MVTLDELLAGPDLDVMPTGFFSDTPQFDLSGLTAGGFGPAASDEVRYIGAAGETAWDKAKQALGAAQSAVAAPLQTMGRRVAGDTGSGLAVPLFVVALLVAVVVFFLKGKGKSFTLAGGKRRAVKLH